MVALRISGAARGRVNVRVSGVDGVRSSPAVVPKDGVMTMSPAVVPVWSAMVVAPPLNTALVGLAAIVKLTVRVPFENCTAGSSANTLEMNASFRAPWSASGYGAAKDNPMAGCWAGLGVPRDDWN